jgi:prepilin-type N-terminal cleavage/methylation domain-containing protein/prepilin-type processing-associated H-X9-DG protein
MCDSMRRAFTLIELLVVIAIIAILAGILFPVFAQAREAARKASCLSNLKQIAMAVSIYQSDFESYPMYAIGGVNSYRWYDQLAPYVKNERVFVCPSSGRTWSFGEGGRNATYGYNYQYLGNTRGNCWNVPVTDSLIQTPANTIVAADTSGTGQQDCRNQVPSDPDWSNVDCGFNHGYSIDPPVLPPCRNGSGPNVPSTGGRWALLDPRHAGGTNFAFLDGHARWMRPDLVTVDNRWWNGRYPDPNP